MGVLAVEGRERPRTDRRALAVAAFVASAACLVVVRLLVTTKFGDLRIYRLEGLQVLHGHDLYGHLPGVAGYATYPPFAGVVFCLYAVLSLGVLEVVNAVLTLAALVWTATAACRLVGARVDVPTAGFAFAALFIWAEPVFTTFGYGQINLYLLALVLWDFTRPEDSRWHRWRGLGVGLAAGIKVTPAVFLVYLFLTRRFAFGFRALGTFAATLGVSLLVNAHDTVKFWTDYLFDVHRVGRLENAVNQTVRGWAVRADHTRASNPVETALVVLVAVAGLAVAVFAYRRLGEAWGLTSCALTGLMCSPIAWSHHWVWCVPVLVLLWFEARVWFAVGAAVFFSFAVWWIPHSGQELHLAAWQVAISGWYVLFGLAYLALTAWRCRSQPVGRGDRI